MKQIVRYSNMIISNKLKVETRIIINDQSPEFTTNYNGDKNTSIGLFPIVSLVILRPPEVDENGSRTKAPWHPSDSLGTTKFSLPILIRELKGIQNDLNIPELYVYSGKKLELNKSLAEKARRVFLIGKITVELSCIILEQEDGNGNKVKLEGIKMKFNNEDSIVNLTLNELESLIYNLDHMDVDNLALSMYLNYISRPKTKQKEVKEAVVDIEPKTDFDILDDFPL